jgi:hypothetical protein
MTLCADAVLIVKEGAMAVNNIDKTRIRVNVITHDIFLPVFIFLLLLLTLSLLSLELQKSLL